MIRYIAPLVALSALTAVVDVATAGSTKMAVPSRTAAAALETLSHKTNVLADVLTVDRREYLLHLDGSGGGALSGPDLTPESASQEASAPSVTRIPFEHMALVYFREIPANAKNESPAFNYPGKETYPSVAAVGVAEGGMDCGELDVEIARAGTIRWYARQQGVVPFTEHEALAQHGKNTAKYIGIGALVVLALAAGGIPGGGGGGGSSADNYSIAPEAFRWAVTAADRRELGLMQLKHKRSCPAVTSPDGATSDLETLARIEKNREALDAHRISDLERRDQQTTLLDQLDPPASATSRVASAADFAAAVAAANEKKAEPLGGAALASYVRYATVEVKSPGCAYPKFGWPFAGHPTQQGGPLEIRERALTWTRDDSHDVESLQFKDIEELRPAERQYGFWFIPIRKADGSCLFLHIAGPGRAFGRDVHEQGRSQMLARMRRSHGM